MIKINRISLFSALMFVFPFFINSMDPSASMFGTEEEIDSIRHDFKNYFHHRDSILQALEECSDAPYGRLEYFFEPCSRAVRLRNGPKLAVLAGKLVKVFEKIDKDFVKQHGDGDKVTAMMKETFAVDLDQQAANQGKADMLLHACSIDGKWHSTRRIMQQATDTSDFNDYLPQIIANLCRQNKNGYVGGQCKELQSLFYHKEMDRRGEFSPFEVYVGRIHENDRRGRYTNVVPSYTHLELAVRRICGKQGISIQTEVELIRLTKNGYSGDGKCEQGSVLDQIQEADRDHQINQQFPELLRNHCNMHSDKCDELREILYLAQNPSKKIVFDINPTLAKEFIWKLFQDDRDCMKAANKQTGGDLCSERDRFGCRSEEEVNQCIKDFNTLVHE